MSPLCNQWRSPKTAQYPYATEGCFNAMPKLYGKKILKIQKAIVNKG